MAEGAPINVTLELRDMISVVSVLLTAAALVYAVWQARRLKGLVPFLRRLVGTMQAVERLIKATRHDEALGLLSGGIRQAGAILESIVGEKKRGRKEGLGADASDHEAERPGKPNTSED